MPPQLARYAAHPEKTRGRHVKEDSPGYRNEYQRDRDRIVHCTAFRRLEYKTQVFINHEGDLFRTRLTHTLEVAQIGRAIARTLHLNEDLTEAVALAHDLGHTPFGHVGQDVLHDCMREFGGFEHNLQSLRVVDLLEEKYAEFPGLNLTFETREGILKHCSLDNARLLGDVGERFLKKLQPSLEAQLANFADEIAYNNHDVDDGLRAELLSIEQLRQVKLFGEQFQTVVTRYPDISGRRMIHEIVRRMINRLVTDLITTTVDNINKHAIESIDDVRHAGKPIVSFSPEMQQLNLELKQFLRKNLYTHFHVLRMTRKAKTIMRGLFDAFMDDIRLLPPEHTERARECEHKDGLAGKARTISDYIAGMTDRYAFKEYNRLFATFQFME